MNPVWLVILASGLAAAIFAVALLVWILRSPAPLQTFVRRVLWPTLRVAGWLVVTIAILAFAILPAGPGLNFLLGGVTIVVLAMVLNRRQQVRRNALAELLAVCGERSMPLEPVLTAFGNEWHGSYSWRIERLVAQLQRGLPLADALQSVRGLARPQTICAARVGAQTGQLGAALRDSVALSVARGPMWNQLIGRCWLLLWPVLGVLGMLLIWQLLLQPKFEQIWDDFGLPLPPAAQLLIDVTSQSQTLIVTCVVLAAVLLLVAWLLLAYIGWIPFYLPIVSQVFNQIEATLVLRQLALICDAGRPLGDALRLLADNYPARWVRKRLRKAVRAVDSGQDWATALKSTRLISAADARLLVSAQRLQHLPWALRVTADANERRFNYRLLALVQMLFPFGVIGLALVVLVLLLGVFQPLVSLIEMLSQ